MKKKILIIISLLFLVPINVHALSGALKITCDKQNLIIGSSTTCHITATTDGETSSLHSVINASDGLELSAVTVDDIWEGDNDKVLDLYTADNKSGTFNVATFVIKATKAGTQNITLNDTKLGDKNFKEYSFSVATYNVNVTTSEEPNNSSSSSKPSSSSASSSKPSSSSSVDPSSQSSKPSSSSTPSSPQPSSNSQATKNPNYKLEVNKNQVYVNEEISISFTADIPGLIKITNSNTSVLMVSSEKYNLSKNETKIFKLIGKKTGTSNITVEFIPTDTTYKSVKETHKITIKSNGITSSSTKPQPNPNENVDVNPPTGSRVVLTISILGILILGYSFWYYRTNKQN